jgi:hypothetical protein
LGESFLERKENKLVNHFRKKMETRESFLGKKKDNGKLASWQILTPKYFPAGNTSGHPSS